MINSDIKKSEFIKNNLGLVHSCANKFRGRGIEYDDLFSSGCMGLIKAFDVFDENRGVKFSTYAVPVILGEIKKLFRDGGAIKVSRSLKELSIKTVREREYFTKINSREPTISELSTILETTEENIVEALNVSHPPISLTIDDEENDSQIDIKIDNNEDELADLISLKEVINKLEEKDKNLITLRYFNNKTQTQTAKILNMTQVQVSRREKKILLILREKLKN